MRVKAVLFDLGGTLTKTADIPEIIKRILEIYGVEVSSDHILEAHRANESEFDVVEGQLELGQHFWVKWNRGILGKLGIHENREFLARKIDELWWDYADLEAHPDVMETLTQLKARGVKTAVVTNALKSDYQKILGKLKLTSYFDVVVGMDTCNTGKPNREMFLYALNKLRIRPREALFIGDSIEYDYEGAKGAGLRPFIIDREGKAPANVNTVRSLTDVLSFL